MKGALRTVLSLLLNAVMSGVLLWGPAKADEPVPIPRIGVLMPASSPGGKALADGLRGLGYAEGES